MHIQPETLRQITLVYRKAMCAIVHMDGLQYGILKAKGETQFLIIVVLTSCSTLQSRVSFNLWPGNSFPCCRCY
eukprot:Gb_15217 [translate_table: standard]